MYAYVELSNTARTDSIIQSLSWMNYVPTTPNPTDSDSPQPVLNLHEGWLATGNTNQIVSVTYTSVKAEENSSTPDRTNFNLRAHRSEVRLVSWNVPYQKLATVDEKGVIFVWVKHDNRWSLELINDRSNPVIDMAWSHDGRMTVICYEDGFILAGSVTGQRYWSTILAVPQGKISTVTWMPDVSHVILGTTSGQLIVMNLHGVSTDSVSLTTQSIRQLLYSCNKFYPEAPNNDATKFVNDDYILACSLTNGQVLFLTHYQDQSPITVDTGLQNVHMDWSYTDEILAVGGHKRLDGTTYTNQILFYNRRGEFRHRVHIPQTTQPLSALCWAHGKDIVFAACGSSVYTIWIIQQSFPSMLTLCQMKIKQTLLNNSLQNLDELSLPTNLKDRLCKLYRSTIKGFLPDPKNLRAFVCNPLKSHLRLQCTMKRIDNEREQSSAGNQFSGTIYILYLEYLGGLVPLLTAKRISKICPDFIIFDPQVKSNHFLLNTTSLELTSPQLLTKKSFRSRSSTFQNISNIQPSKSVNTNNRSSLISNRSSIHVAKTNVNHDNDNCRTAKETSDCSSEEYSAEDDEDDTCDVQEKLLRKKVIKSKHSHKLCTIAANIWGTKFKFYGHSNHLPEVLGSVTYKTSFLHLQPRQMTVTVANNDNNRKQKQSTVNQMIDSSIHRTKLDEDKIPISQSRQSAQKKRKHNSQRKSIATTTAIHRPVNTDISTANSSSTSPINLSRSTSPAASIANFVRPISPPCIQMKEPLSPKFSRASSTSNYWHCSPPSSIAGNTNASTASATRTFSTVPNVPESCFEPETYRNLYPLHSNQQKKLSFSDPTLNQTTKLPRRSQPPPPQVVSSSITTDEYLSASSLRHQLISKEDDHIHTDDDEEEEIENLSSYEEPVFKRKPTVPTSSESRKKYFSPRHRMMACTSGRNDSLTRLSTASDTNPNDTSFYVMQNRPPLWNEQSQVYQLDFGGRVTLESAKNFQIELKGKQVIQFGRIENNCYTLDFEWPFSPLQAFAIALANITQRLK